VSWGDVNPLGPQAHLALGYRTAQQWAIILLGGVSSGTNKGLQSSELCSGGITCRATQATIGLGLHVNDPDFDGVWADLPAVYAFTRFTWSGEPTGVGPRPSHRYR